MLVPVHKAIQKVRLKLNDMQSTKYSDYEVLSALNDGRTMLHIALSEHFSRIGQRTVEITAVDGVAQLPDDYYTLVDIGGGYIVGNEIVGVGDTATITYHSVPKHLMEKDNMDIPASLFVDLVEVAKFIVQGDMSSAVSTLQATAKRVSQKREYAAIPDKVHFP